MFLASLRGRSAFLRVLACVIFLQCIVANAQVTRLSFRPIDAAYSKSLDRLILVSENPNQLHIYNVTDRSDQTVALGGTPLKLSVSPDGTHAAVGFSTSISYVDLQGVRVERTFTNGSVDNTTGLLLGPGYVYTFPKFMGYAQSINLSTGELTYGGFANADGLVFNSSLSAIYTTSGSLARLR